jgi:hypothetical protein
MREEPNREMNQEPILNDENTIDEEEYPTKTQDSQNTCSSITPNTHSHGQDWKNRTYYLKRISNILTAMDKQQIKPSIHNDWCDTKSKPSGSWKKKVTKSVKVTYIKPNNQVIQITVDQFKIIHHRDL